MRKHIIIAIACFLLPNVIIADETSLNEIITDSISTIQADSSNLVLDNTISAETNDSLSALHLNEFLGIADSIRAILADSTNLVDADSLYMALMNDYSDKLGFDKKTETKQRNEFQGLRVHSFGVQIGTDIGGALPTKLEFFPAVFTPYPKISLSIGAVGSFSLARDWDLRLEANYKTIGMDADALVENQLAILPDDSQPGGLLKQYFSGQAIMQMSFTMLEIPLYAVYTFPSEKNKILFGGYGAWTMRSGFVNLPQNGFTGIAPDNVGALVTEPMQPGTPGTDFGPFMSKWDAGIVLGYERKIYKRINLGLRVYAGFKDIFVKDVFPNHDDLTKILQYNMSHMRGAVTLSYNLFEVDTWWRDKKPQASVK